MPKLKILNGPRAGTELSLSGNVLIGRGPLADLSFDDPLVSRRHAMLTRVDGEYQLADLQSDNGTFVNRKPLANEPARVRHGDVIEFGAVAVEYRESGEGNEPPRTETSIRVVDTPPAGNQAAMKLRAEPEIERLGSADRGPTEALVRRLRFINDLGRVVSKTFDEGTLLSFVLDEILELVPQAERVFVMTWDGPTGTLVPRAGRTRSGESTEIIVSRTILDEVIQKREGLLIADALADPRFSESASVRMTGLRSAVCVPMLFQEELYGLIQVDSSGTLLDTTDGAWILGIASHVAMALAYSKLHARLLERELLERDLSLARRIQRHFLPPRPPDVAGYEFVAEYSPALAVGGDFFDFLELADGRLGIAVGDVSGKGVSAALYVAKLSSDVRYHSVGEADPAAILTRVNKAITARTKEGMFITMVLATLDPGTGELVVASAGHPLPLLRRGDGTIAMLGRAGDLPLGLRAETTYSQHHYSLQSGDLAVLYSDGVTEARSKSKELFGGERLSQALRAGGESVPGVFNAVLTAVKAFAGNEPQADDLTLVCFGRAR